MDKSRITFLSSGPYFSSWIVGVAYGTKITYPLVMTNIAVENHHVSMGNSAISMTINGHSQ